MSSIYRTVRATSYPGPKGRQYLIPAGFSICVEPAKTDPTRGRNVAQGDGTFAKVYTPVHTCRAGGFGWKWSTAEVERGVQNGVLERITL